jgi:hypothetical protein
MPAARDEMVSIVRARTLLPAVAARLAMAWGPNATTAGEATLTGIKGRGPR